jgi:hypothetical protein
MDIDTICVGCPQLSAKSNIPSEHTNPAFFIRGTFSLTKMATKTKKLRDCNSTDVVFLKKAHHVEVTGRGST